MLVLISVAGMLAVTLRTFVVEPFWIPSESMEQTLHGCTGCNDDRLLVDKLSYKLHPVHRGDVVVFRRPPSVNASERVLIKRVIGLSGETVRGRDGGYQRRSVIRRPPLPRAGTARRAGRSKAP